MADALDSKSSYRKVVWVQLPPPVLQAGKGLTTTGRESFFVGAMPSVCNPYADISFLLPRNGNALPM